MKKLITMILILALVLMIPAAFACESAAPTLPNGSGNLILTGPSWWTLTEDNKLASIKDEGEMLIRLPFQSVKSQYVRGRLDNGWARDLRDGKGVAVRVGACGAGLTKLTNVTITIYAEYTALAASIVENLMGEGTELNNANAAACATWLDGDWASTIVFPSYSDRLVIGEAHFNGGADVTPFCVGTFGGCLRFGLMCGFREAEPAKPAETVTTAQANAKASASVAVNVQNSGSLDQSGDGCYRNNTTVQVNFFSIVKNWLNIGNKGGCEE